jgi:hypothetical protein
MMDRICIGPDGNFIYERSSSSSPSDTTDNAKQVLPEVPEFASIPDTKMAAMPDPIIPNYGMDIFLPQDLDVDDLDNVNIDSLDVQDSIHASLQDMPVHDTRDQSFSDTIYFEKEPDFEQEPQARSGFAAAKLPDKTSDSTDILATHPVKTSDSKETPVAKLPSKSGSQSVDIPPEPDFAIAKGKKKTGGRKKPVGNKNEPKPKNKPKKPVSIVQKGVQKVRQLTTPRARQTRSSDSSSKNSSTKKSLGAKSDTSKKSANSFAALSEEQDFRDAESG